MGEALNALVIDERVQDQDSRWSCAMIFKHNMSQQRTQLRRSGDQAGFSLHAGIACKSNQRKKLERLCRYITRPAIAERRLSLANNDNVVIALKTPYDDGTTHVVRRRPHSVQWNSWGAWQRWCPDHGSTSRGFMVCSRGAAFRPTANCVKTLFSKNL